MTFRYRALYAAALMAILVVAGTVWAAQVHPDMSASRLAEVQISSAEDLRVIEEIGGIVDNVQGHTARVYLLSEDFKLLEYRGYAVHWIVDDAQQAGQAFWNRVRRGEQTLDDYHTNDQIQSMFASYQVAYPSLFHYESIGLSYGGRNIWAAKLSDNVTVHEPEIEVKYTAAIHGDEVVGKENCLRFIDTLLTGYGTDAELTTLMNNYEIWIIPLFNPDGNAASTRYNGNGVDLNRDFPMRTTDSLNTPIGHAPETADMMAWSQAHNFVMSANFHGGALVVNYPWDDNYSHTSYIDTPTPEDALFEYVSLRYSILNTPMYNGSFTQGITNGTLWYVAEGSMQDWNYTWAGDKDVTIEISNTKWPAASTLQQYWVDNRASMRAYLLEAQYGIRGVVTDSATGLPLRVNITAPGNPYPTYSESTYGQYYRVLRPGTYSLTFSAAGYQSKTINGIVVPAGSYATQNVALRNAPRAQIVTVPTAISQTVDVCGQLDIPFTIQNTGDATLTWSALEADTNFGGWGSAVGGGWRYLDSHRPGGPVYGWKDISTTGTQVVIGTDDGNQGPFPIGFTFPYYGSNYTTFRMSANGWISFTAADSGTTAYTNINLPGSAGPANIVAPWWDDLSPQRTGTNLRRWTNNVDSLVVSYQHVQSYQNNGLYNFEIILQSSGKITFQYGSMGLNRLNSATIGLQNGDKTKGLSYLFNTAFNDSFVAISFCPASMVELSSLSGSVPAGNSVQLTAHLRSCCVPTGISSNYLDINSNDPLHAVLRVLVTLNVTTVPPNPVDDLVVIPDGTGIRLMWNPAANATGYKVYRMDTASQDYSTGTLLTPAAVSDTTFLDDTVGANTVNFYQVTSVR